MIIQHFFFSLEVLAHDPYKMPCPQFPAIVALPLSRQLQLVNSVQRTPNENTFFYSPAKHQQGLQNFAGETLHELEEEK